MEIPANNESEAAAGVKCFRQLFAGTPKLLGACTLPPSRRLLSKNSLPFPGHFNLKQPWRISVLLWTSIIQNVLEAPRRGSILQRSILTPRQRKKAVMQNTVGGDEL